MVAMSQAGGLVGLLSESDPHLQAFALEYIHDDIDLLWSEIAESVSQIEALFEDESFPDRDLAAVIVAKIYFHLGEYDEAMAFALHANKRFDVNVHGEFEDVIISRCIDAYIELSRRKSTSRRASPDDQLQPLSQSFSNTADGSASMSASMTTAVSPFTLSTLPSKSLLSRQGTLAEEPHHMNGNGTYDSRPIVIQRGLQKPLQAIVDGLFAQCYEKRQFRQVIGVAVEGQDLSVVEEAISKSLKPCRKGDQQLGEQPRDLLQYTLVVCTSIVQDLQFRDELLQLVAKLLEQIAPEDYFAISKCIIYLDQPLHAAQMLSNLIKIATDKSRAIAYQLAFDLYSNSTQDFLERVRSQSVLKIEDHPSSNGSAVPSAARMTVNAAGSEENESLLQEGESSEQHTGVDSPREKHLHNIHEILQGLRSVELEREFLFRNNHAEIKVLLKIKDSLDARNSIFHSALTFANAFMHSGTSADNFFRDNLDWLGKAVNWSKFSATAGLGVIHRGNLSQGMKILDPYLPKDTSVGPGSPYSQGGSLFALGLIYANHGSEIVPFLESKLIAAEDKVIQHGGALGIGAAAMATGSTDTYDQLRDKLYVDNAESGEALGMSMGLVMLGSANHQCLEDMISFAHETQHDKTIRGLAVGMAFIMFGKQEKSDALTNRLLENPEPAIRYGGIMTIAMAYCGTSSNRAVRRLLHVAVSDVSDDVRRIAVMSLGFILFRKPSSVPRMVELLSESYNPHVRYGAAMALGIACAGTGLDEAVDILEPMQKDPTDFVRQGAHIALAMILIQQTEASNPKVAGSRKAFAKVVGDKHEDAMTKFGACLGMGIIDAGGRNCTISLQSPTGNLNMPAIVGIACFTQYWYWFPFTHFLSLSFTPTAIIGLDADLEVPEVKLYSATKPSLFDYPPTQEAKTEEGPTKVATAVLSTTAYAKRRAQRKEREARTETMDIDKPPETPTTAEAKGSDAMEIDAVKALESGMSVSLDSTQNERAKVADSAKEAENDDPGSTTAAATGTPAATKSRKPAEKVGYTLDNMSRVPIQQLKYVSFDKSSVRYQPVRSPTGGVILLHDTAPGDEKHLVTFKSKRAAPETAAPVPGAAPLPPQTSAGQTSDRAGAAVAGGPVALLNAVDEDDEWQPEAPVPEEFEYETDGEEEDEQAEA